MMGILIRRGDSNTDNMIEGQAHRRRHRKMDLCKARGEVSGETKPANTLISDFWPPNYEEIFPVIEAIPSVVLWYGSAAN